MLDLLRRGTVIPAHPLALNARRQLDERRQRALARYYLDAGSYPTTEQGLAALIAAPSAGNDPPDWAGPYIEKIPPDPWGHTYFYQSDGNQYLLKSFGADGAEGGEGKNADIDGSSTG